MLTREQAEAAILEFQGFATEDGWTRAVTIEEMVQIPLAEAASTMIGHYDFILFEKWCWACKFSYVDSYADGRREKSRPGYCYVVMPVSEPLVVE